MFDLCSLFYFIRFVVLCVLRVSTAAFVPALQWVGGCRAGGASWGSGAYTREGLADVNLLAHGAQKTHTLEQ